MKIIMKKMKALNMILTRMDRENAIMYMIKESILASPVEIIPRVSGRYGFDILSDSMSVTWFNALDAPFSMARVKLAGIIVFHHIIERSSVLPL